MVSLPLSTLQFHSAVLAHVEVGLGATPRLCGHAGGLFSAIFLSLIRGKLVVQHILEGLIDHSERPMDILLMDLEPHSRLEGPLALPTDEDTINAWVVPLVGLGLLSRVPLDPGTFALVALHGIGAIASFEIKVW
jgi:hypothetical protein